MEKKIIGIVAILILCLLISGCGHHTITIRIGNTSVYADSKYECPIGLSIVEINDTGILCSERSVKISHRDVELN